MFIHNYLLFFPPLPLVELDFFPPQLIVFPPYI
nr:MAG TPA: hypothetical protein [Caudoviricetes sp.]